VKNWFDKCDIKDLDLRNNTKAPAKKVEENVGKNN
jgi:hypothetical protein